VIEMTAMNMRIIMILLICRAYNQFLFFIPSYISSDNMLLFPHIPLEKEDSSLPRSALCDGSQ
jgi:hypothetical protein